VKLPRIKLECGSHMKAYEPSEKVTVQVISPLNATVVI
jgi:hypothetical protein